MKLIRVLARFARGKTPSARRDAARGLRAVTVPAPRGHAAEAARADAAPAARLADFRCNVPLRLVPAEPPTPRN